MDMNPFKSVSDYATMLNKIAISTFSVAVSSVIVLRWQFQSLDSFLSNLNTMVPVAGGINFPVGTLLPAFLVALLSRIFKCHDRISDLFGIRQRFDVGEILLPLAVGSGSSLTVDGIRNVKKQRESLMNKVFYKYASSTKEKSTIDHHYITMALDQWCWYWIVLEATSIVFLLGATFFVASRYLSAALSLAGVLLAIGILQIIRQQCAIYALQEVEAILEDRQRAQSVAEGFHAVQS